MIRYQKRKKSCQQNFQKLYYYIRKINPFSPHLFKEIKQNFDKLKTRKNNPKLNNKEKDKLNKE